MLRREDKFGYAFMVGSIAVPLLIVVFFDDKVIAAGVGGGLLAITFLLLFSGHAHRESPNKRSVMSTIVWCTLLGAIIGASSGLFAGIAWVVIKKPHVADALPAKRSTGNQPDDKVGDKPTLPEPKSHAKTPASKPHPVEVPPKTPAPGITQTGQNNIAQVGDNNQAIITVPQDLSMTDDQEKLASDAIRGKIAGTKVSLMMHMATAKTEEFGVRFVRILKAGGAEVRVVHGSSNYGFSPSGLYVQNLTQEDSAAEKQIAEALVTAGIIKALPVVSFPLKGIDSIEMVLAPGQQLGVK